MIDTCRKMKNKSSDTAENLDIWISTCTSVITCCDKIFWQKLSEGRNGLFYLSVPNYCPSFWESQGRNSRSQLYHLHTQDRQMNVPIILDYCCLFSASFLHSYSSGQCPCNGALHAQSGSLTIRAIPHRYVSRKTSYR